MIKTQVLFFTSKQSHAKNTGLRVNVIEKYITRRKLFIQQLTTTNSGYYMSIQKGNV